MIERLLVVAALIVLVGGMSLLIRSRLRRRTEAMAGHHIPPDMLPERARHGVTILYFWGPHCAPCRQQGAVLDAIAEQVGTPIVRIDAARHAQLARSLGVLSVPATAVLDQGRVRAVNLGLRSQRQLEAQIGG